MDGNDLMGIAAVLVIFLSGVHTCSTTVTRVNEHQANCAKLLRECRKDSLSRFECKVHLKQFGCEVD